VYRFQTRMFSIPVLVRYADIYSAKTTTRVLLNLIFGKNGFYAHDEQKNRRGEGKKFGDGLRGQCCSAANRKTNLGGTRVLKFDSRTTGPAFRGMRSKEGGEIVKPVLHRPAPHFIPMPSGEVTRAWPSMEPRHHRKNKNNGGQHRFVGEEAGVFTESFKIGSAGARAPILIWPTGHSTGFTASKFAGSGNESHPGTEADHFRGRGRYTNDISIDLKFARARDSVDLGGLVLTPHRPIQWLDVHFAADQISIALAGRGLAARRRGPWKTNRGAAAADQQDLAPQKGA